MHELIVRDEHVERRAPRKNVRAPSELDEQVSEGREQLPLIRRKDLTRSFLQIPLVAGPAAKAAKARPILIRRPDAPFRDPYQTILSQGQPRNHALRHHGRRGRTVTIEPDKELGFAPQHRPTLACELSWLKPSRFDQFTAFILSQRAHGSSTALGYCSMRSRVPQ